MFELLVNLGREGNSCREHFFGMVFFGFLHDECFDPAIRAPGFTNAENLMILLASFIFCGLERIS